MLYVDGLWASKMVLHIHRDETVPIPKEMRDTYIKLELSPAQMNAVAAVLGLGYRDGEILFYRDDDVDNNIMRDDGLGIRAQYYALNCEARKGRIACKINKSLAESSASKNLSVRKDANGLYDFCFDHNAAINFDDAGSTEVPDDIIEYTDDDFIDIPDAEYKNSRFI